MTTKKCASCGDSKPLSDFHLISRARPTPRSSCKTCERERIRRMRKGSKVKPVEVEASKDLQESHTYVVTYAQNATPVHANFFASLLTYCKHNNAKLVVIPGRYKNPTSIWSDQMEHDEWWDSELKPYLYDGRTDLGNVTLYGDISIQPTAVRPLSGFEVFAGSNSAIFGHPKIQLHTVATARRRYPRIFATTGAVTLANYTRSKAGKKSEAHHVFGAAVIELDGDIFHLRQINAVDEDGTFIDLDQEYTPFGVRKAKRALALVCGDIHVDKSDGEVLAATFGKDSIIDLLQPEKVVYHDLLDFDTRNHHRINDFTDRYPRAAGDANDSVEAEVNRAIKFVDERTPSWAVPYVILSNHDEAFDRWLNSIEPKHDPVNALFFHEAWYKLLKRYNETGEFTPALEMFYDERGAGRAHFIRRDETLKIADIYCNYHGDKGVNGARGSTLAFSKLGVKTVTGHSHSPAILDGAVVVGVTGDLDQGYNYPPSSWMHAHCVVYANSKRSLIFVVDGKWRAP